MDKFACTPLNFHDFSLISNIYINIHEYANLIICICKFDNLHICTLDESPMS